MIVNCQRFGQADIEFFSYVMALRMATTVLLLVLIGAVRRAQTARENFESIPTTNLASQQGYFGWSERNARYLHRS